MILQMDVGNSATKWRLREQGLSVEEGSIPAGEALPKLTAAPIAVWVASVADPDSERKLTSEVNERWGLTPWFARSSGSACGLTNSYEEPARMGVDRWLAMIAGYQLVAGPLCVVDAGSALTIDFVDATGVHSGGYILPGMDMMERALLGETARVRYGDAPRGQLQPGTSTAAAVYNGLHLAQVGAVATAIARFGEGAALVFSGGNGERLMEGLALGGSYHAALVLDGLEQLATEPAPVGVGSA